MSVSSNIKKASKADIGGIKKNKVDVSFALFFDSNHIKIKKALVSEKHRLENDMKYIEKLAREKYRMAKPGEKVFKVIDSNKESIKE